MPLDEKDATIVSLEKKIEVVKIESIRRARRIVAVLMIVALIAAVAIGFISGALYQFEVPIENQ